MDEAMKQLRAELADIAENAVHAADPREPARRIAAAWAAYFDATQPAA